LAFGKVKLIFGETIITDPFAVCFLYHKDQRALVTSYLEFAELQTKRGKLMKMVGQVS